jgi:uncharacterized protein YndB with AHSA1/START domain
MPHAVDAVLQDHDGRFALRFERVLRHAPERVWRSLTERGELDAWHPTPFDLEPTVGGVVSFTAPESVPDLPEEGEVTEYDPPRTLAYTWGEDHLRWELRPHDGGCLLVLTHAFDDRFKAARDAAGWHLCLEALSAMLEGAEDPRRLLSGNWREVNSAYEERFDIPPEKATPPPSG